MDKIKFFGLDRQYASIKDELLYATDKVYSTGKVLDGQYVNAFENAIAERTNRDFAIAVNSCSQALLFSYMYYANKSKSKNIALPAVSFVATSNAPAMTGYSPVFVDVTDNGLMDLDRLRIKEDDVGIISYVNLFGNILDYDKLMVIARFFDDGIPVVEDAAQSFGASYKGIPSGKLGDVSCLSFDPTKNLPNFGSGGMVLTDDEELFHFVSSVRSNGTANKLGCGTNSKMSEADCAQMLVKLKYFDQWQARRTKIAEFYNSCLHPYVDCPRPNDDVIHAWHKYAIQTESRGALEQTLTENNIETRIHYVRTLSELATDKPFEVADRLAVTSLSLPIYPELTDSEVERIVSVIQKFYD